MNKTIILIGICMLLISCKARSPELTKEDIQENIQRQKTIDEFNEALIYWGYGHCSYPLTDDCKNELYNESVGKEPIIDSNNPDLLVYYAWN